MITRSALRLYCMRTKRSTSDYRMASSATQATKEWMHRKNLNDAQLKAVTFPPSTSLQILAGPGTGKTQVLASRACELVYKYAIATSSICVISFTRKSANEMRKRLQRMLKGEGMEDITVGTFHVICVKLLKGYGASIGVTPNFLIWDKKECQLVLQYILEGTIPKFGDAADDFQKLFAQIKILPGKSNTELCRDMGMYFDDGFIKQVYEAYQKILKRSNALDFEDLLVKGLEVVQTVPWVPPIARLTHVLVDEFQDTSLIQYRLARELSKASGACLGVVGDPDQLLYTWRNAEPKNLAQMKEDFPGTHTIFLEENYRSTASILKVGNAIISQDKKRPQKTVFTSRLPNGPLPAFRQFSDQVQEAEFIAREIQRVVADSNGLFEYGDCAVLLRGNWVPSELWDAFVQAGVPFQVHPQPSPFESKEVRTVLSYLRLAINTAFTPSLLCVLEGPHRLRERIIASFLKQAIKEDVTLFQFLRNGLNLPQPNIMPHKNDVAKLMSIVERLKRFLNEDAHPADLIAYILGEIIPLGWPDNQRSMKKVLWFQDYAKCFIARPGNRYVSPTHGFLKHVSQLLKTHEDDKTKVNFMTCHSAKGLEWPIVFIPQVVDGNYPHHLSTKEEEIDEERRIIYVACTRAQNLLYLSHGHTKTLSNNGGTKTLKLSLSPFLRKATEDDPTLFQEDSPKLDEQNLELFRRILNRHPKSTIIS